jgi:uncharacterized protein with NAD-binding domain and iron-sulfur cluster
MAGLSAAWRLSEPGWQYRYESITVYQRGWRLGGKGASSRGLNRRIEEHGLHIWLGCYDNAFAVLRECYAEIGRATADPQCPITDWSDAFIPADTIGLAEQWGEDWQVWLGTFTKNDEVPGEPGLTGREMTVPDFLQRAVRMVLDFADSILDAGPVGLTLSASSEAKDPTQWAHVLRTGLIAAVLALSEPQDSQRSPTAALDAVLENLKATIDYDRRSDHRRSWLLISMVTATIRGMFVDKAATDPRGFKTLNDEDFTSWIMRHGAHPDVLGFPLLRGLYDFVFGHVDGDHDRPQMGAGIAVFLIGLALFQYRGSIFWKMTAGMGDVVIAPMYQALRRRGVRFEFFHRVDALHLDARRQVVDAITVGRQARLAEGLDEYQPLVTVGDLPVFPDVPDGLQLAEADRTRVCDWHILETPWGQTHDVESRRLRCGVDFDRVVLAMSVAMMPYVAAELIDDQQSWRDMTAHIRTVATQSFQLWLRPDEKSLGWTDHGVTTSGYIPPFETWASMGQTLWAEQWPAGDQPQSVAYFCGTLGADPPPVEYDPDYLPRHRARVLADAVVHLNNNVATYLPGAVTDDGFAWHLLCGAQGRRGADALTTQHVSVNIDPSDRYVQAVPGSDRYRLRPDESGYDNAVLCGDWTDSGWNAGCIEAAVISGLEAANALLGRGRFHRIRGWHLP